MTTESRPTLPMASTGCSCCAPSTTNDREVSSPPSAELSTRTTSYAVEGMTCGHCVGTVIEAIKALEGVEDVRIDLQAGGVSTATVTGSTASAALRTAIEDAGYSLARS
ncbi:heavy-metal-associated domain-containing protein [Nesterenkonia sandarakina]|uniref:Copper chaperone CopZ n=1 Tax=Nesterenkonia sandarakina TaxID=272918 RepID=A0A7Z0E5I9_9MICC|nr:heavy-metal-associated domain-containing protein [Nesterenkonia sandarakina]NYJ15468.1 copper chaperone CopZ [Nesterenkonia sandarakina]